MQCYVVAKLKQISLGTYLLFTRCDNKQIPSRWQVLDLLEDACESLLGSILAENSHLLDS